MEEPTLERLLQRFDQTISFCTDMGVESGIAEVSGLDIDVALPHWMREEPLCPDSGSEDV